MTETVNHFSKLKDDTFDKIIKIGEKSNIVKKLYFMLSLYFY